MNGPHFKLCFLVFGIVILYKISIHFDRLLKMGTIRSCRAKEIFGFTIQSVPASEHISLSRCSRQCLLKIVRITGINHIIRSRYSRRTYRITTLKITIFIFFYRFECDIQVSRFGFKLRAKLSRFSYHIIRQRRFGRHNGLLSLIILLVPAYKPIGVAGHCSHQRESSLIALRIRISIVTGAHRGRTIHSIRTHTAFNSLECNCNRSKLFPTRFNRLIGIIPR